MRKRDARLCWKRGGGHGAPLWLLLTFPPPSSSSHTLSPPSSHPPEEHSDVWIAFSSRLLFPCQACARVQESLCRWWVWLCPCVSLCQRPRKGRPEGVVLHFYSFINSPLRSDCGCQIGPNGRRDKEGLGGMHENAFIILWIIMSVMFKTFYTTFITESAYCNYCRLYFLSIFVDIVFFLFLFTIAWWRTCPLKDLNIQPTYWARFLATQGEDKQNWTYLPIVIHHLWQSQSQILLICQTHWQKRIKLR